MEGLRFWLWWGESYDVSVFLITSIVLKVVLDSEESQLQMIANFNGTGKAKSSFFHLCLSVMSDRFDFLEHFTTSKHHAHVGCQSARTCVNLSSCRVRNLEGHLCFQYVNSSHVDMLPTYRFSLRISWMKGKKNSRLFLRRPESFLTLVKWHLHGEWHHRDENILTAFWWNITKILNILINYVIDTVLFLNILSLIYRNISLSPSLFLSFWELTW